MCLGATILDCATIMIHFLYFALSITDPHTSLLQTTTKQNKQQQQPSPHTLAQKGQQEAIPMSGGPEDPGDDRAAMASCC